MAILNTIDMIKKIVFFLVMSIILTFTSCKGKQVGCMCEDGWVSDSMGGPGTCSHHGGVDHELYESYD